MISPSVGHFEMHCTGNAWFSAPSLVVNCLELHHCSHLCRSHQLQSCHKGDYNLFNCVPFCESKLAICCSIDWHCKVSFAILAKASPATYCRASWPICFLITPVGVVVLLLIRLFKDVFPEKELASLSQIRHFSFAVVIFHHPSIFWSFFVFFLQSNMTYEEA